MPTRVHAIQIVVDSVSSKENFSSIVEFWNYCHLVKNHHCIETITNCFNNKNIYYKCIYYQALKTWSYK